MNNILINEREVSELMLKYNFALQLLETQFNILIKEFEFKNKYNPVEHMKSRLKTEKSIIDKLNKKSFLPSDEVNRLNNEINRMFDSVEIDREVLRTKMFSCVSEKYSSLDNDLYTAKKLQLEFERPITDDWMQKFNRTVREIRMHRNKAIGVVLLNGQIIGKEQKNGNNT